MAEGPPRTPLDVPFVVGNRFSGIPGATRSQALGAPINTTFLGTLSPPALLDPGGSRLLVYSSFDRGIPALRARNISTRKETILERGAYSLAWRGDGALAYVKAPEPRVRDIARYVGHVVVRNSLRARPLRWTRKPARYVVAAWADDRLLAYRLPGQTFPDLMIFDAPLRARMLARKSALVALSPDARYALVARYGSSPPLVRILAVADGAEVGRLVLDKEETSAVTFIAESGSWVDDTVFAPVTYGVAAFRVRPPEIELEQLLEFDTEMFPIGPLEPRAAEDGRRILLWAELQAQPREAVPPVGVFQCDRVERACSEVAQGPSFPGARIVYNPSRP